RRPIPPQRVDRARPPAVDEQVVNVLVTGRVRDHHDADTGRQRSWDLVVHELPVPALLLDVQLRADLALALFTPLVDPADALVKRRVEHGPRDAEPQRVR